MQHTMRNNSNLSFLTKLIALSHLRLWFVAIYVDAKWLTTFSMGIKQRGLCIFLGLRLGFLIVMSKLCECSKPLGLTLLLAQKTHSHGTEAELVKST